VIRRAEAGVREALARQTYARAQAARYRTLLPTRAVSEEAAAAREQEEQIANAGVSAARQELVRARADNEAGVAQRDNLRLLAPVDGLVVARNVEPGTTVVAGQTVIELIDPQSLWINARFDQIGAGGLAADLPAEVRLRSRRDEALPGVVVRVEPMADTVTEETLAKISLELPPGQLPPVGELAEVTLTLPALEATTVIPSAAVQTVDGAIGVWLVDGTDLEFRAVRLGIRDLEGNAQVLEGLDPGQRIVLYSEAVVTARSRIHLVERIAGVAP
jgi:RND family efflux transporter MFP subunit